MACTRHDTFFILHVCRHACARKIDDVETLMQSTRARTRCVAEARVHVRYLHAKSGLRAPWRVYSTAQFKLDKARMWHVLNTTHFSFCTRAGMHALARSTT